MKIFKKILRWFAIIGGVLSIGFLLLVVSWFLSTEFNPFRQTTGKENFKKEMNHLQVDDAVPSYMLKVTDVGKNVDLKNLKGKVVFLFMYSACPGADEFLPLLGKLSERYEDDLAIYIIPEEDNIQLQATLTQYPKLHLCRSRIFPDTVFPYPGSYHSVLIDKNGILKAYGHGGFIEVLIKALIENDEFTNDENALVSLMESTYKMVTALRTQDEYLHYEKSSGDSVYHLAGVNSINLTNIKGYQIYQIVMNVKLGNLTFDDIDTTLLSQKYNFNYGIRSNQFLNDAGYLDLPTVGAVFKDSALKKLDKIFGIKSEVSIVNGDRGIRLTR